MTFPRKLRRCVTVDTVKYHYCERYDRCERTVIRRADNTGSCIFVLELSTATRRRIENAVRYAIQHDWNNPTSMKVDYWIEFHTQSHNYYFELLPKCDYRVTGFSKRNIRNS